MSIVGLRNLCSPAIVYLAISLFTIIMMFYQNYRNLDVYCLGEFSCKPQLSVYTILIIELIVVLFWTWILNIICSGGYTSVAWFLVLLPYIVFLSAVLYILFL